MALVKEVPQSIRYTWSSSLPVGTEISTFFGNQKIIVVGTEQTNKPIGEWLLFSRNLKDDMNGYLKKKCQVPRLQFLY